MPEVRKCPSCGAEIGQSARNKTRHSRQSLHLGLVQRPSGDPLEPHADKRLPYHEVDNEFVRKANVPSGILDVQATSTNPFTILLTSLNVNIAELPGVTRLR